MCGQLTPFILHFIFDFTSLPIVCINHFSAWFVLWKLLLSKMPVFRAMFGLDREETVANQAAVTPTEKGRNRKVD